MSNSEVRDAIIQYFIEQLHTRNINQISVVEIVHAVGISRVTFYNYFSSKVEVVTDHILDMLAPSLTELYLRAK